jgi:hypothetical protein
MRMGEEEDEGEGEEDRSENKENKRLLTSSPGPDKRKITIVEGEAYVCLNLYSVVPFSLAFRTKMRSR